MKKLTLVSLSLVLILSTWMLNSTNAQPPRAKILVDLTHAERVSLDGKTSPDLLTSKNPRILSLDTWADFMRDNGYFMDALTQPPITGEKLSGYDILMVAQPDVDKEGKPAYFSPDEVQAIQSFLEEGGGLWLVGDPVICCDLAWERPFMELITGAMEYILFRMPLFPDVQLYFLDFSALYHYPEVLNELMEGLGLGMKFNFDLILDTNLMTDPYFYQDMASAVPPQILNQAWVMVKNVAGGWENLGMGMTLILPEDNDAAHPLWEGVDRFMVGWGCSVDVAGEAKAIGRGSKTAFTIDRMGIVGMGGDIVTLVTNLVPLFLNPSFLKPPGGQPVAMAIEEHGRGKVLAWGDLNWVQKEVWVGVEIFHDPYCGYEQLVLNIADYLSSKA